MSSRRLIPAFFAILALGAAMAPLRFDRYRIATGSMAPTYLGKHLRCDCPRCGAGNAIGVRPGGADSPARYAKASCWNCSDSLPFARMSEQEGDQVDVDRWAFALGGPRRWDVVLFRRGEETFAKRIAGLPGESVAIRDGDVWIDGRRARKTFAEAIAMRQEVFDDAFVPQGADWSQRWERSGNAAFCGGRPDLDGMLGPQSWTYVSYLLDERQYRELRDEYAYDGFWRADAEPVHDFLVEAEATRIEGQGNLRVALTDGADVVTVSVPVDEGKLELFRRSGALEKGADAEENIAVAAASPWPVGTKRTICLAFVDRRIHVAIDGVVVAGPIDLPDPEQRVPVVRPVRFEIAGVRFRLDRFRLARDVHYRPQGMTGQAVRLGGGEYFVLGDRSPVAEDSRTWQEPGVRRADLLGRVVCKR